jgi:peptidoglycan/LPS O-acetylase OafA/YrhL
MSSGSRGEIKALTSLRGVAALAVMFFHFRKEFGPAIQIDRYTPFLSRGYYWVDFFFVLSGFVIAYVYESSFRSGITPANYRVFALKRLGRIYPLHIFTLMCFVLSEAGKYLVATTAYAPFSVNTFEALVANIFLVQAWGIYDHYTWNHPAWSISTEWFAYLIFPFLALVLVRIRSVPGALVLAALCLVGLEAVIYAGQAGTLDVPVVLLLPRCVFSFILGMLVFWQYERAPQKWSAVGGSDFSFAAALAATLCCFLFRVPGVVVVIVFVWVVLAGSMNRGRVARALENPVLYFLGTISYSLYLVHSLVQRVWQMLFQVVWHGHISTPAAVIVLLVLSAVTIAASTVTYRYVERPGRDLFARWSTKSVPAARVSSS